MKEWYLASEQSRGDTGVSDLAEILSSDGMTALDEIMDTGIKNTVQIYDSDMSNEKTVDCIISNKSVNTYLGTHTVQMLCHPNTIKAGKYVKYNGRYWLTIGLVENIYDIYEKIILALCQIEVKWQNETGAVIKRWANANSASKYDTGLTPTYYYTTASNNFTLIFPSDDEVNKLYQKRVFLGDHDLENKVFKITRDDDILYMYGDNGECDSFIVSRDKFHPEADRLDLGLCDYFEPKDISGNEKWLIGGDSVLYSGLQGEFSIEHYTDGAPTDADYSVEIDAHSSALDAEWSNSDGAVSCKVTTRNGETTISGGGKLLLTANDTDDIGNTVTINVIHDGTYVASKNVAIENFV